MSIEHRIPARTRWEAQISFVVRWDATKNQGMQDIDVRRQTKVPAVLELARGKVIWLADRAGLELLCNSGALWVTEGRIQDIVLRPGESLAVDRRRRALVHAMDDSRMTVRPGGQAATHGRCK